MVRQEIYINNTLVDLTATVAMPLTFNIADIRYPESRNVSYSKTISLPATKNNNILFTNIFEINKEVYTTDETVNYSPDFNPNLKAECLIYIDSILQLKGYVQLVNIVRTGNSMMYECVVYGEVNNIFADIGENKLTDLDLSKYDHAFTAANIVNSWDTSIQVNGVTTSFAYGSGYVYGMLDLGFTDGTYYNVGEWFPSIYLKTYIDHIFSEAGYSYTSTFFTSDLFKHFVIPFNKTKVALSKSEAEDYLFKAEMSTQYAPDTLEDGDVELAEFDTEVWDIGDHYNNTTFRYVADQSGSHIFDFTGDYNKGTAYAIVFNVYVNGVYEAQSVFTMSVFTGSFAVGVYGIDLVAGDYVEFKMGCLIGYTAGTSTRYTIDNFTVANRITNSTIVEGSTMPLNLCIPKDILQKDLLLSVIKMFNLYVEVDKSNSKNLIIEPRTTYYSGNSTVDWTTKLDVSNPIEIKPLSELAAREYVYTFAEDKDYYNELYTKETGLVYGEYRTTISNDFQKSTNTNKVIFSPTPMVGSTSHDRVIPKFITIDANGVVSPRETNIRLLYYGGLKSTNEEWELRSPLNMTANLYPTYPYMGHLDDPYEPAIGDLNFGIPEKVYWNANDYINKNVFSYLHEQFLNEITSRDSKMLTAYFYLTPMDIYNLNFRNYVFVKDAYYIINKIIDYDFLNNKLTKVELLKINAAPAYSFTQLPAPPKDVIQSIIIEGGEDEVRDVAARSPWTILEGGEDEVRDIAATSFVTLIEGGQN